MIRKTIFAISATTAILATALPTAASAHKWNHHGGRFLGGAGIAVVGTSLLASSCLQYQWVPTRYGMRQVLVNVCGY